MHTSMRLPGASSRDRNREVVARFGIKDAMQEASVATEAQIARHQRPDQALDGQQCAGSPAIVMDAHPMRTDAVISHEQDIIAVPDDAATDTKASKSPSSSKVADVGGCDMGRNEIVMGGDDNPSTERVRPKVETEIGSILTALLDRVEAEGSRPNGRRQMVTGTKIAIERVAFAAQTQKGVDSKKVSAISTVLKFTGLHGRAQGQFNCLAGVVLVPSGLVYIGETDSPLLEDVSHIKNLRLQNPSPRLTSETKIDIILCEAEKEQTETWRLALMGGKAGEGEQTPSPEREPRIISPIIKDKQSAPHIERLKSVTLNDDSMGATVMRTDSGLTKNLSDLCYAQPAMPKPLQMRCWGLTFIADVENHCIQVVRADGKHVRRFGTMGKEPGQFHSLQGLVVDDEGEDGEILIYVTDTYNHRIQVFELRTADASDMKLKMIIGKFGRGGGEFNYPIGITMHKVDPSEDNPEGKILIVADTSNDRIQFLTSQGKYIRSMGILGKQPTTVDRRGHSGPVEPCFKLPYDVVVIDDLLFVTDHGNHRIQVLTLDGQHVRTLGSDGVKATPGPTGYLPTGVFNNPRGLMQGPCGTLLVSDDNYNRVQILSADCDLDDTSFTWRRLR